jgi:hypothetical protein
LPQVPASVDDAAVLTQLRSMLRRMSMVGLVAVVGPFAVVAPAHAAGSGRPTS